MAEENSGIQDQKPSEVDTAQASHPAGRVSSQIVSIDRRGPGHTVFHVDEATFTSSHPRTSHWSIAWSDLMMTMFILFLSMFVYQMADEEFLQEGGQEIIGGDTTEALQILDSGGATLPFPPIQFGPELIASGTIRKVEPSQDQTTEPKSPPPSEEEEVDPFELGSAPPRQMEIEDNLALVVEEDRATAAGSRPEPEIGSDPVLEPRPLEVEEKLPPPAADSFQEIYKLSRDALESNNLDKFAAIDLVPDKTVRIILTGDLLFALGKSDLSTDARESLSKIGTIIKTTPYMINVVGHTDNIPMSSARFKNNWELSLARANTVTQFLIKEIGMNPGQFIVSGYSSYRPTVPNDTATNRARNRRVEVIISKRLPSPQPASPANLN